MRQAPAAGTMDAFIFRRPTVSKTSLDSFRQALLQQRASLLDQLAQLRGGPIGRAEASAEHFGQPGDTRAQAASERELEYALDAHETAALEQIDAALERIQAGTYGLCSDCGEPIAPARLQSMPQALRCIRCQDQAEHA